MSIDSPYAHDNSAKEPLEPAAAPAPEAKRHDDKEKDGKKNVEKKNDDRSPLVINLYNVYVFGFYHAVFDRQYSMFFL